MTLIGLSSITYTGSSPVYIDSSGVMKITATPTVSSGSPSAYTVEYSSQDPDFVLVNSSTGVITILGTATPGSYGLQAYVTDGGANEFWSNYDFVISSHPVTGVSSISFVGTVVNDPTLQNLGYTDHSYYTYTNATVRAVASVNPTNATDKTVTWSYVNNSGSPVSAIDANGNITLSGTEGIVTLTAHAQDTSSGWYNSTIKLSVVYPDYTFNITNTYQGVRTDSNGKKWIERHNYSTSSAVTGETKLDFQSAAHGYVPITFHFIGTPSGSLYNYSTNGSASSTMYGEQGVTSAIYGNITPNTDMVVYARRLGYFQKLTVRVQYTLYNLVPSLLSTTSGPTATTDGVYNYFYLGSTVVVQAEVQSYQNIGNVVDASMNWIASPEFTITPLVGTYTLGGVGGFFRDSSGNFYRRASITVNSYTATPALSIKATSPDTISPGFNPVIRRSVTGMNSITGTTTVQAGSTTTLSSSVQPANAYNQGITWSSSDITKATVNSSGVVTGVAPGTATITAASAESATYSTTTTVTVTAIAATSISAISFTGSTPVRTTSTGLSVSATVSPANASNKVVVYTSSNTAVATVNSSTGIITPVAAGTTTITATASDTTNGTLSSTYSLTVYNPVAAISAITRTGFPATIYTDSTGLSIAATVTTANVANSAVSYSSSATGVATVNSSTGAVTIVGAGSVTLTATSSENAAVSSTTTFTVYNHVAAISAITRTGFPATIYTDATGLSIAATITTANVANSAVSYSSSATGVATVNSSTGAVTIVGAGSVTLTATSVENPSVSSTTTFTVYNHVAAISAITRIGFPATIYTDSTGLSISAAITTANVANSAVSYSSSATGVATVNSSTGAVTIVGAGSVTLTATSVENAGVSSTTTFTVYNRVAAISSITRTGFPTTIYTDSTGLSIAATVTTANVANSAVSYSSSATGVATVNSSTGAVTIVEAGSVTLTATSSENAGVSSTTTFTVYNHVAAISAISTTGFTAPVYTSATGLSISATITTANVANSAVTYSSDATGVATVNSSTGAITIVGAGVVHFTATSAENAAVYSTVSLTVYNHVSSVNTPIYTGASPLYVGGTGAAITATVTPSTYVYNSTITYSTSDATICDIGGSTGALTPKKSGTVTLTATSADGSKTSTYSLQVYDHVSGISALSYSGPSPLYVDSPTESVSASVSPTSAYDKVITYTSSDATVLSVNSSSGILTPHKAGQATITGTSHDGSYTSTYTLTVYNHVAAMSDITTSGFPTTVYTDSTGLSISASITTANVADSTVSYSSSNTGVATINASTGVLIIVAAGTTTLRVESVENSSIYKTYSLTVNSPIMATTITSLSMLDANATPINTQSITLNGGSQTAFYYIYDTMQPQLDISITRSDSSTDSAAFVVKNAVTDEVITSNDIFYISGSNNLYSISTYSEGVYKIEASINGGTSYIFYLKVATVITNVTSTATISTIPFEEGNLSAYNVTVGTTIQLDITRSNSSNTDNFIYNVYDMNGIQQNSAISINNTGVLTGNTQGVYNIVFTLNDNIYSNFFINAIAPVAVTGISTLTLADGTPSPATISVSDNVSFTASLAPADATNKGLTYTSSDNSIADFSGFLLEELIIHKAGTITVTATTADGGFTKTFALTITDGSSPVATTGLAEITSDHTVYDVGIYNESIIYVGSTETSVQLYTAVQPNNATNQSVTWQFYNNGSQTRTDATISNSGLISFSASSAAFDSPGYLDPYVIQGGFSKRLLIVRRQPPSNTNSVISSGSVGTYKTMDDVLAKITNISSTGATTTVAIDGTSYPAFEFHVGDTYTLSITQSNNNVTVPLNINTYNSANINIYASKSTAVTYTHVSGSTYNVTATTADTYQAYVSLNDTDYENGPIYIKVLPATAPVAVTGISDISSNHSIYTTTPGTDHIIYVANNETSVNLYAAVAPTNATNQAITWAVANSQTNVSVDSYGVVSFQANASFNGGIIIITATANGFAKGIYIARGPPNGSYTLLKAGTVGYGSPSTNVAVTGISSTTLSGGSAPFYTTTTGLSVSATVQPTDATNKTVSYSSSATGVATVNSSTGAITIVGAGSTTLTSISADGSYTSTYSLTVYNLPAAISALTGSWGSSTVYTTSTGLSVSAIVTTTNVYNSGVSYSSSNTAVATVNSSTGAVTVVGAGTTTLSAVPADNTNSVTASTLSLIVSAPLAPNSVTSMTDIVLTSDDPMHPNQWNGASVTVGPANATNKDVTWTSSNPSVLRFWDDDDVTQDVVLVAKGVGTTTLRATSVSNSNIYKEITIRVYARTTSMLALTYAGPTPIRTGDTATLGTLVYPPSTAYQGLVWSTSDSGIATVDASGVVTAVGAGSVVISATSVGIPVRTVSRTLTILAAATRVTGISAISYTGSSPFRVNGTGCFVSATVEPTTATNTTVTYSSDNTAIASVSSTGMLTGNGVGTCTITATTADGGFTSTYPLTVDIAYVPVTAVTTPTLTGPSPLRVGSSGVSISAAAQADGGATPTNAAVLYYTNTVAIATVDKNTGAVTFKDAGAAEFYAISSDNPRIRSSILSVTVLPAFVPLTGISDISANNQSPVLVSGQKTLYIRNRGTLQLRASPVPTNATNNAITWASSSAGITVDASGLATSVTADADTVITATDASGNSKTVNLKHIVNVGGVNMISLSPDSPLEINTTAVASSGTYPANATYPGVSWSVSPSGILTIDQSGNVSAIAPGDATIYATAIDNSGIMQSYSVTVSVPFVEITGMSQLSYTGPKYLHVAETGGKVSAYVMPTNATNQAVTYTWSPTNLLSIDASGNITALAAGTATIYASATESDGITQHQSQYVLTIYPQTVNITGVDCLEPDVVLDIGSTITFRNPLLPAYATNNQVTWISVDPEIASVNENGTVTGITRGTTTITATSIIDATLHSSYIITIAAVPVSDITPIGSSTSVYSVIATNTLQLSAQVVPSNAGNKKVDWLVSDTSLATIDASGILTAIAPGSVVVRASADDNPSIYREVTVSIAPKRVTGISDITAPSNVITIEYNNTMTLSANVLPIDATNKNLIWTSSNSAIIEVLNASTGLIKGKLITGTPAIISATTVDGNFRKTYTMTCVAIKVQDMDPITTSTGSYTLNIGDNATLITQVLPTTAAIRTYGWSYNAGSSANALQLLQSVASLNQNTGEITALSTGYVFFKAVSGGLTNAGTYVTKTVTIKIGEPVESLTPIFYGMSSVLQANQTKQLSTSIVPTSATQSGIFWSSSQIGAAIVSQTGVVTVARNPSVKTFTITATPTPYNLDASGNIISVSQTFTITIPVTGISAISPNWTTIHIDETRSMAAYIQPLNADNKNIILSIVSARNAAGQTVVDPSTILSASGLTITGVAKGSAVIKITSAENAAIYSTLSLSIV